MPFTPKNLDDRDFESLVEEAKRRIPAYLPEWTDHNESDPGIALVQLFAWLTETAIFRLNQAPDERMYVSFLDLVGLAPAPATSSTAYVELKVRPGASPLVLQPYELRFSAGGGDPEIAFEPDAVTPLFGVTLAVVLVDDGVSPERADFTQQNEAGDKPFAPFGPTRIAGRALYLGFDASSSGSPVPPTLLSLGTSATLQMLVRANEAAVAPSPSSTSFAVPPQALDADVVWSGGVDATTWQRLELLLDESRGLRRTGLLQVKITDELKSFVLPGDVSGVPRFWIRAEAAASASPDDRSIRYVAPNAARVRQWKTYADELLPPGSDGTPAQRRTVLHPPILVDPRTPVEVTVTEPDATGQLVPVKWSAVEDLGTRVVDGVAGTPGVPLRVFRVLDDRTGIEFGDGIDGMIPPRGVNNIHVNYRSGGGSAGNVGAGAIELASSIPILDGASQREPASGGTDPEDVAVARANAPSRLRALERAVTAADFETLALERAGAARATALNRYNPLFPAAPVTAALTLVVVPPRVGDDLAPLPTQGFLDSVAAALEPYRVLTTELFVVAPTYHEIVIAVNVDVALETDAPVVRAKIGDALRAFFDPISGGRDGRGWPLGGTIFYGEVLSVVLKVERVLAVRSLSLTLDGVTAAPCADVTLDERTALLESGAHSVTCNLAGGA